jgi:hypothetical protein
MIPAASRLSRPRIVGRKYSSIKESRVSTVHTPFATASAQQTPPRLYPTSTQTP